MFRTSDVVQLMRYLAEYEENHIGNNLSEFAYWLNNKLNGSVPENLTGEQIVLTNNEISSMFVRLNKFSKFYLKCSFKELPINSIDEFLFLQEIDNLENPSKTEVYENTLTELPSGTQIMKRLQTAGLVEEFEDPDDRRVRRVRLTGAGKKIKELANSKVELNNELKLADLPGQNKQSMLQDLRSMNSYHSRYYKEATQFEIQELVRRLGERTGQRGAASQE